MPSFPASLDLDDRDETRVMSFSVLGADAGARVSALGDVNGDGIADLLVSVDVAPSYEPAWQNYVVYGSEEPIDPAFTLDSLDGTNGFRIENRADWRGSIATSAGDLNGDGFADIALVSSQSDPTRAHLPYGDVHVIFGGTDGHGGNISVAALDGVNGFTLTGPTDDRSVDYAVISAGDVDGDGFSDLAILRMNGRVHMLMGTDEAFAPTAPVNDAAPLLPITGSLLEGQALGDLNGDGYDEMLIGRNIFYGRDPETETHYPRGPFADRTTYVSNLNDTSLIDFAPAGDVNGDGYDDFIFSDGWAEPHGHTRAGAAYVVFGRAGGLPSSITGDYVNGTNGFAINGDYGDFLGGLVAGGADINGDGFDDVVAYSGRDDKAYVIYGRATFHTSGFDVADITGANGFVIENAGDALVDIGSMAGAGDVTGDGLDDFVFGEYPRSYYSDSQVHVLPGRLPDEGVTRLDSAIDQTVWGGDFDDTLISRGGNDTLIGGLGNDRLVSVAGTDILNGGFGDDTYVVYRDHADQIVDSGGIDTISAKTSWDLTEYANIENLEFSTAGNWLGYGNELDNLITAGAGNNRLFGAAGNDTLSAGAGDDLLSGGTGDDLLSGGSGSDRFDFADYDLGSRDVITDFAIGQDTINLGYMDADTTSGSNQSFHFIGEGAFSGAAGELRYHATAEATLVQADVDGDGIADFQLELSGTYVLGASDFIL